MVQKTGAKEQKKAKILLKNNRNAAQEKDRNRIYINRVNERDLSFETALNDEADDYGKSTHKRQIFTILDNHQKQQKFNRNNNNSKKIKHKHSRRTIVIINRSATKTTTEYAKYFYMFAEENPQPCR